ncbi:MAG: LysR family transcriptional regulator [Megasphaera sp.]|uniref:LysR family transcriptional regulator n=1 Tax=Megasphaera sp. TaxID=2023260 RepID=UPI003EFFB68A
MEIRTLQYFLAVAREQNMTGAANMLHITQPTLSRQMADLEQELGKKLFVRTNRSTLLTEEGIRLRQRAEEIISLVQQTKDEISDDQPQLAGCIRIGAGETKVMHFLTDTFAKLHQQHPAITCELFTGNADTVEEKLSHGLLDFALFIKPFNADKYESLPLPEADRMGIITQSQSPWSHYDAITPSLLKSMPLLVSSRTATQPFDFAAWSHGELQEKDMHIVGTFDLIANASLLVKTGVVNAVSLSDLYQLQDPDITYIPLLPPAYSSCLVAWKKYQLLSPTCEAFLKCLKEQIHLPGKD